MIPKILHHIWISDKECPEKFKQYTDTWSKIMPDYKIEYTTLNNIHSNSEVLNKLIKEKKYTLVNHYMRYWVLYHIGGIYLDLDIEVVKSFDDLLDMDFIIGREDNKCINNAVMGCEKGNDIALFCANKLHNFDYNQDQIELKTGPWLTTEVFKYADVLPLEYFYPYHYSEKFYPECIKPETHTVHHWNASWQK